MIVESVNCEHGYSSGCPDCDVPSYLPAVLPPATRGRLTDERRASPDAGPLEQGPLVVDRSAAGPPVDDGPADNWGTW